MSQKANKKAWFRFMQWTHFQLNGYIVCIPKACSFFVNVQLDLSASLRHIPFYACQSVKPRSILCASQKAPNCATL